MTAAVAKARKSKARFEELAKKVRKKEDGELTSETDSDSESAARSGSSSSKTSSSDGSESSDVAKDS